jgi:5'-3' exonuclease
MGITGFSKFFSEILVKKDISELKNKIVIIDTVYILYKYCIAIRNSGKDYVNKNGNLSSHLIALFNLATFLLKNKITPIFIFDGKTPEIKKNTIQERKKRKLRAINELSEENNENNYIKNFKKSFYLEEIHFQECQLLLKCLGINYIIAPEEADSQCATLSHYDKNLIAGIISDDTDILAFGGTKLLKNFNIKNKCYDEYTLDNILELIVYKANIIRENNNMEAIKVISQKNFITYCILLGNDYIDTLKHYKFDKIFELLVLNDFDINKFLAVLNINENYITNYLNKFNDVYNYYTNALVYDNDYLNINYKLPINVTILEKLMCQFHDFSKEFIIGEINKIIVNNISMKSGENLNNIKRGNIFAVLDNLDNDVYN